MAHRLSVPSLETSLTATSQYLLSRKLWEGYHKLETRANNYQKPKITLRTLGISRPLYTHLKYR